MGERTLQTLLEKRTIRAMADGFRLLVTGIVLGAVGAAVVACAIPILACIPHLPQ